MPEGAWNRLGFFFMLSVNKKRPSNRKQILKHLQSHSLLEPFQSAYRKCHSTETALLRVVNDLLQASDRGCVSILSLLDLLAAFDTIDHNILITRLRSTFGCSGTVLEWFISYLSLPYSICVCGS